MTSDGAMRAGAMGGGMRAVALGGGHGLFATLSALRRLTDDVTAVVTVADDGGSSGRLRRELGMLPPGDLRMALVALAAPEGARRWQELFQHRFGGNGALAGHAVGNLLLAGLVEVFGDPVAALDEAARLLGVTGRVLPMAAEPLQIEADVAGLGLGDPDGTVRIKGQVAVATTPGRVRRVRLTPDHPRACRPAVQAVLDADVVVLGPGSWFTSVLPHLLVPELAEALVATPAKRLVLLNLVPQPGETAGFSPEQHLTVLAEHAPQGFRVDAVLADSGSVTSPAGVHQGAALLGGRAYLDRVAAASPPDRHDPDALAEAIGRIFGWGSQRAHERSLGGHEEGRRWP